MLRRGLFNWMAALSGLLVGVASTASCAASAPARSEAVASTSTTVVEGGGLYGPLERPPVDTDAVEALAGRLPASGDIAGRFHQLQYERWARVARSRDRDYDVELAIAACMGAQGFVYVAVAPPRGLVPWASHADELSRAGSLDPLRDEFREAYGYGWSTLWAYSVIYSGATENDLAFIELDPSEQRQYQIALHGATAAAAFEAGEFQAPVDPTGCIGRAYGAVYERSDDAFTDYDLANDALEQWLEASAVYVDAERDWVRCVRDRGYELAGRDGARDWAMEQIEAIDRGSRLPDAYAVFDDPEAADEVVDGLPVFSPEEAKPVVGSPYDHDELREVQAREIEMALELQDCDQRFDDAIAAERDRITEQIIKGR